ncbi:MAG: T9SS type A sorting domain-containing protein [Flavobacteriales bacterium]
MRTAATSTLLLSALALHAQNWALLNPAYKYNYSNDGSDTISNQIFITHIDTLGPDSFKYELNKVVVRCDTCTTVIGGNCNGCFLSLDQAGPFGGACTTNGDHWRFEHSSGTWSVLAHAAINTTWLYDPGTGSTATVDTIMAVDVYGMPDSVKVITLSTGDTLLLSREHGVLGWPGENGTLLQIGEQTTGSGVRIPTLSEFITYQPGDVAQYTHGSWGIGMSAMTGEYWTEKLTFLDRIDHADSIEFQVARITLDRVTYEVGFGQSQTVEYTTSDTATWVASSAHLPFFRTIGAYPGQEIRDRTFHLEFENELIITAEHGFDPEGHHIIRATCYPFSVDPPWWNTQSLFMDADTVATGILAMDTWNTVDSFEPAVVYQEGPGLVTYQAGFFETSESYRLDGAVIGGDTIGELTPDDVLLGVPMQGQQALAPFVFPNPAQDLLMVRTPGTSTSMCRILDTSGKQVRMEMMDQGDLHTINVSALPAGLYVMEVRSSSRVARERFIISR